MQERYNIDDFYFKLYGKDRKNKLFFSLTAFILIFIGLLNIYFHMHSLRMDTVQSGISDLQMDEEKSNGIIKEEMLNKTQTSCKYDIEEQYVMYTDFDADGKKEMFVFVPTEIDNSVSYYEDENNWINYGEVWFCDGENTILVDEIGMDDWQGGGYYSANLLQFGDVYHMQLCKYYGPLTLSQGPINIYAYEDGLPIKTQEGYINNAQLVDGGGEYGVYYSTCALKGSTQLTGRTWDKVYVYYKDGEYIPYESKDIDISELCGYDNFEDGVNEGIKEIYSTKYKDFDEDKLKIMLYIENVNNKLIYVYQCEFEGNIEYFTLFNSYINKSGRIYLNLTNWNNRNDFLNSTIWNDDERHAFNKSPVESPDNCNYENVGYNYYITFRNRKNVLEVEEVSSGFW